MHHSIGFTGTQLGMTGDQAAAVARFLIGKEEIHHGDCIGADAQAHALAEMTELYVIVHPPVNDSKRAFCKPSRGEVREEKPYLQRNRDIVSECSILIAAPKSFHEEVRSGTWATVRYAKGKIPTVIVWPDGSMEEWL
jgi:hypothetical protein